MVGNTSLLSSIHSGGLLVPSFRPLLAPVPRLRLRTDTHAHTHTRTHTHTQTHMHTQAHTHAHTHTHTHMHTQERDHWITAALEDSHEDVNSDEYFVPGTPQSSDLEEAQISDLPATPPQLPVVGDLDTGIYSMAFKLFKDNILL